MEPNAPGSKNKPPTVNLVEPRAKAAQLIRAQIEKGKRLRDARIDSVEELNSSGAEHARWANSNRNLLLRLFDDRSVVDEYDRASIDTFSWDPSFEETVRNLRKDINTGLNILERIDIRLEHYPQVASPQVPEVPVPLPDPAHQPAGQVFIVARQADPTWGTVCTFIELLGVKGVVLTEPAAAEQSVFAEAEAHPDASYAIVIMSPEAAGPLFSEGIEPTSHPGQNAILHLGYFAGKLGHQRVCALYRPGMEIPSSRSGIQHIELDNYGGWRLDLGRTLRAAGFQIDLNQALWSRIPGMKDTHSPPLHSRIQVNFHGHNQNKRHQS